MNLDFIPAWANAIAQFEGYNAPGNLAAHNHNPGNLKYAGQAGAIGADSRGFAVFSSDVAGFQALYRQLTKYVSDYPGDSILDITAHYLGQPSPMVNAEGDAFTYAAFVASALGVDPSTTLAQLAAGEQPAPPVPQELAQTPAAVPDLSMSDAGPIDGSAGQGVDTIALWILLGGAAWVISRMWG